MHLYQALAQTVQQWREQHHPHGDYPVIAEILHWAANPEGAGFRLRAAQMRALEAYWYLRLVEHTPNVADLYRRVFPRNSELLAALGLSGNEEITRHVVDYGADDLLNRIRTGDEFVRAHRLEAVRETLSLPYPSYILALAMGAGKTALIGAIFATEFAMALEYPDGLFVQNALVFAPGKTIIESLRQLAALPFDRIIPPRLYKPFAASVKLTFTRDGQPDIPVIRGSVFNVVVTNTEKIRIQKESIRKSDLKLQFANQEDEARMEWANLRLSAIASLPHLAIFSDEAHHTYGQALDTELKKVRKTVDYLAANTNVVCVVNTTGTPYYQRQPLRDVVVWYGLSEGIRDGVLKDVGGNIRAYSFEGNVETYLAHVVEDFFKEYGAVTLPDGTPAKLAIYFPQTDDVEALRPVIETKLAELGLSATLILEHHTRREDKDAFDRFRSRDSIHRVALLVDRGVEGWDVPALFACALARKLKSSNNFVLQAASRCLRQVPGNTKPARIYLSVDNRSILDRQLQETYGESISELNRAATRSTTATIRLRKLPIPPLVVRRVIRTVARQGTGAGTFTLSLPAVQDEPVLTRTAYAVAEQKASFSVLRQVGDSVEIAAPVATTDLYAAAGDLARTYRVSFWRVYDQLRGLYLGSPEMPATHVPALAKQIEEQIRDYAVKEETIDVALALVKPEGFERTDEPDGTEVYTAEITFPVNRKHLLLSWEEMRGQNPVDLGFHYTPYNFDSNPEKSFFELLLAHLNLQPGEVQDIYFTGALTSPEKTDFRVEYKGEDGRWHYYTPDFVIMRKDGRCLIVEVKNAQFEAATVADLERGERGEAAVTVEGRKAMALRQWERLNPERLKYELVFAREETLTFDNTRGAREFLGE